MGSTTRQVDRLIRDCLRWPEGPFELQFGARLTHDNEAEFAEPPRGLVANYHAAATRWAVDRPEASEMAAWLSSLDGRPRQMTSP
jgi:hypothetical protein